MSLGKKGVETVDKFDLPFFFFDTNEINVISSGKKK